MKNVFLLAAAALLTAACSASPDTSDDVTEPVEAAPEPDASAEAPPPEPYLFEQKSDDGSWNFKYAWPAKVSAIPDLAAMLDDERTATLSVQKTEYEQQQDDMPPDCQSCRSRGFLKEWKVVTDIPRYLSLSATIYTYTGGAHGMTVFDSLVWDREAQEAVEPIEMFRSPAAVNAAVRTAFCKELDRQRVKKRGDMQMQGGSPFSDCIEPVANSTIIPGSASGRLFDRVGFLIPPYNAGPYAEGAYEVTLPVTPALLDAVKPEYRRSFMVP